MYNAIKPTFLSFVFFKCNHTPQQDSYTNFFDETLCLMQNKSFFYISALGDKQIRPIFLESLSDLGAKQGN